jgi:hypothetical protein
MSDEPRKDEAESTELSNKDLGNVENAELASQLSDQQLDDAGGGVVTGKHFTAATITLRKNDGDMKSN